MKISKYITNIAAVALLAFAATGCSDDVYAPDADADLPTDITLTLRTSDYLLRSVGSRATDESAITSVTVLGSDDRGFVSCKTYTNVSTADGNFIVRASLPKGTKKVDVVTNCADLFTDDVMPSSSLETLTVAAPDISSSNLVMWGTKKLSDMLGSSCTIDLVRNTAKVTAETELPSGSFSITGFCIYQTSTRGTVAPKYDNGEAVLTVASDAQTSQISGHFDYITPAYVCETAAATTPYIVMRATYAGSETWYKIGFFDASASSRTILNLQRNHHYRLKITQVDGPGYTSYDEAHDPSAPYSNGICAVITDETESIYDIIAANGYALGVCDTIYVDAAGGTPKASVVLLAPTSSDVAGQTPVLSVTDGSGWLSFDANPSAATSEGSYTSPNRLLTYTLNVSANAASSDARTGVISVRWHELTRTIIVTQKGSDFKRSRAIQLYMGGTKITDDYFSWLDSSVKGVDEAAMGTNARNQGLHFCTEKTTVSTPASDANYYYYMIPYESGDQVTSVGNSKFTVAQSGSYWKVALTDAAAKADETDMWISSLTITNAAGVKIVIPVYRTGILSTVSTGTTAYTLQVPDTRYSGTFYYEVVKVTGADGTAIYMLDRNLCAAGNGPFSLAASELSDNNNTIGAFYRISTSKGDNIKPSICPKGFTIPTSAQLENINIVSGRYTASNGEAYYCASKATSSLIRTVYFPASGYTEGNNYRNANHTLLWSSTYLAGAQGFNEGSDEYKFWFLCYDTYGNESGSAKGLTPMRFVNGSAGNTGTVFRGMPVRCVRGDSSTANSGSADSGSSGDGTVTVYYLDSDSWATSSNPPRCYSFSASNAPDWNSSPTMTLVAGNLWSAKVKSGYSVIFCNNARTAQYPSTGGWAAADGVIYTRNGNTYKKWADINSGRTVFFYNRDSWSTVSAYCWTGTNNATLSTTLLGTGFYYIQVPSTYSYIIFNSGSWDHQTGDNTVSNGICVTNISK